MHVRSFLHDCHVRVTPRPPPPVPLSHGAVATVRRKHALAEGCAYSCGRRQQVWAAAAHASGLRCSNRRRGTAKSSGATSGIQRGYVSQLAPPCAKPRAL